MPRSGVPPSLDKLSGDRLASDERKPNRRFREIFCLPSHVAVTECFRQWADTWTARRRKFVIVVPQVVYWVNGQLVRLDRRLSGSGESFIDRHAFHLLLDYRQSSFPQTMVHSELFFLDRTFWSVAYVDSIGAGSRCNSKASVAIEQAHIDPYALFGVPVETASQFDRIQGESTCNWDYVNDPTGSPVFSSDTGPKERLTNMRLRRSLLPLA